MHELPATRSVLEIALRHAARAGSTDIRKVFLEIDGPSDLEPGWLRRYWTGLTRGTPAAGSELHVTVLPPRAACATCGISFNLDTTLLRGDRRVTCPDCGSPDCRLLKGKGWTVKNMEVL